MPLRVLLADDHSLFRQGLRVLLEHEGDIEVVAEASDGRQAVELVQRFKPDVVLMDMKMPFMDGAQATAEILKQNPSIGVVVLTMFDEDEHLRKALQAGARGYLLKTANAREVAAAVRAVHAGASHIDPMMTTKMLSEFRRLSQESSRGETAPGLTEREVAVLRLLGSGCSNKEIAQTLHYSESTVKNRLSVIFEKIGVSDRTQAAIYAVQHGLLAERKEQSLS